MRLLIPLLFFSTILSAQSAFLKDPDIVWAAEIEQDWVVDIPSLEEEWDQGVITLKQVRSRENELHWSSPYLAELVYEAVRRGDLAVFQDPDCKEKLNINGGFPKVVTLATVNSMSGDLHHFENDNRPVEMNNLIGVQYVDTLITFDPMTYEEKIAAALSLPDPFSVVVAWRLRQVLAYHKKSARWSTEVMGIAPLVEVRNWVNDTVELRPAFWFKPDNKRHKLHSKRIVWAKKTFSGKQTQTELPLHPATLLKTTAGFEHPMSHLLSVFETKKKSPFYDSQGGKLMSLEERKNMMHRTDTTVSYNWETHEGTMDVEHKGISDSMIQQLRLAQTWYWDDRRARLSICLDAVAPLEEVVYIQYYRKSKGLNHTRPLFYRMAKR
jgi:hypothetical protein